MDHHNRSLADDHWVESLHTYVKPDWNDLVSGEFATKVINGSWSLEAMRGWILQLYPFIHAFPKFERSEFSDLSLAASADLKLAI